MVSIIACLSIWGTMAQQPTTEPVLHPLTPVLTMTGDRSRVEGPRFVLCSTQKEFDYIWERHTGEPAKVYYSSSPAPIIDFKHYRVALIFGGSSSNSQGYKIDAVDEMKQRVRIRYSMLWFSTAGPDGGGVLVQPWALIVLPASDKKLSFESNHPKQKGGPANYLYQDSVSSEAPDSFVRSGRF